MYRWILLAVLAVVVVAEDSDVLDLDSESFQDAIADKDIMLVEFYAPWWVRYNLKSIEGT